MARLAYGRIVIWEGGALWVLQVPALSQSKKRTDFHAHHAIQVTLALEGEFILHLRERTLPGPAVIVPADLDHAFEPRGAIGLLFIDPESSAGRILAQSILAPREAIALPQHQGAALRASVAEAAGRGAATDDDWRELGQGLIRSIAGEGSPPPSDSRVSAGLEWAAAHLDQRVGIAELARKTGLSSHRMSHLFVEQTGLPFRTYMLWLRMRRALDAYAHGASLTAAAYDAGFSDSAHFSRTFRRMFGVAAAELQLA